MSDNKIFTQKKGKTQMLQLHDLKAIPDWLEDTLEEDLNALQERFVHDRLPLARYEDGLGRRFYVNRDGYVLHGIEVDGTRMSTSPTLQVKGAAAQLAEIAAAYSTADRIINGMKLHYRALGVDNATLVEKDLDILFDDAYEDVTAFWRPCRYKHRGFFDERVTLYNGAGTPIVTAPDEGVAGDEDEQVHAVPYARDRMVLSDEYDQRRIMRMVYGDFSVLPREWFDGNVKTDERSE